MTDERTGLPADSLHKDGTRSVQTSTTNIGAYMWSAVVAHRLGLISRFELVKRLSKTLSTLKGMERSDGNQYWNWYDHRTGEKLDYWPPNPEGNFLNWLSSVDNGWLAVGLRVVENSVPELSKPAGQLYKAMDFGIYYVPERNLVRLPHRLPGIRTISPCCYDTAVSESRIVDYIGIARRTAAAEDVLPALAHVPTHLRLQPGWRRSRSAGIATTSASVFSRGHYQYRDSLVVPSWGGSMFEALMVDLFVPESKWAPRSWGLNHPLTVRAQILHGLVDAEYGYWGFSPANVPEGGYAVYGVDAIGLDPNGNPSNKDRTLVDRGFEGCPDRPAKPDPPASAYDDGVVTPHAAFLALPYAKPYVQANLRRLAQFPRDVRPLGFPRQRERRHRSRLGLLPLARSGHDHGRARQRTRARRDAEGVRRQGTRARGAAGDRPGEVRRRADPSSSSTTCDRVSAVWRPDDECRLRGY